ncbi:hypothetical protein AAFC00_001405 [Neodothiora populina]|uniref:Secreted protein n=1 Tax=Neodothiora populina TaxID=2781224 RepID=A0ABR3PP18_9PEZI
MTSGYAEGVVESAPGQQDNYNPPPYNPQDYEIAPALPPRSGVETSVQSNSLFPPPPERPGSFQSAHSDVDVSSPGHYTRDPHKLTAYLIPFPRPTLKGVATEALPPRFLIYTPPPPPLKPPKEGEKESKVHKLQRKWQGEVRSAKTSDAKTASWQGLKAKATRGINVAMGYTKTSNLEFVNRLGGSSDDTAAGTSAENGNHGAETHKTVKLEEIVIVYPSDFASTPEALRKEFVESLMRTKSKAERDAVLATGLLPVSAAIDLCLTLVWPFGGLLEIDAVWAAASFKGAKTSRSVTKRLTSSSSTGAHDQDKLRLSFSASPRLEVLERYLAARCHDKDPKVFPVMRTSPTETDVLEAIGWSPTQTGGVDRNWEDEQWETSEVKDDFKTVMLKAAGEWDKWVKAYEKNPEKAVKK